MRFLTGIVFCSLIVPSLASAAERPNILFAFADDWGRHAGAYAKIDGPGTVNDIVQTPVFDQLAASGVLFRNAFVNAPSCTPCRSSLLSGQHFWRTGRGAILQGAVWNQEIPSWPLLLQGGSYHIGFTFKVWSPGTPADAPYGGRANAYRSGGGRFNGFSQSATRMIANGKSVEEAKKTLLDEVRTNFRSFLAKQPKGRPFAYWFGPTNVHRKWIKGSGKKLWGLEPDGLRGKMPPFLPDVEIVREDLADYFGEAKAFDMALGVLVEELKRIGQFENTIIAISGDHGAPGFPHGKCNLYDFGTRVPLAVTGPGIRGGRVVDDFVSLPDLAPTFLEAGGQTIPSTMTAKSIWPVLRSDKSGLVDKSRTHVFVGRERHVAKARAKQLPYPQRAIRTKDYLYVINFRPDRFPLGDHYRLDTDKPPTVAEMTQNTFCTIPDEDAGPTKAWIVSHRKDPKWSSYFTHAYGKRPRAELFDLKKDPHQMTNVAGKEAYKDVEEKLHQTLMNELQMTGDPRLVDGGKFFENAPLAGPVTTPQRNRKRKRKKQ